MCSGTEAHGKVRFNDVTRNICRLIIAIADGNQQNKESSPSHSRNDSFPFLDSYSVPIRIHVQNAPLIQFHARSLDAPNSLLTGSELRDICCHSSNAHAAHWSKYSNWLSGLYRISSLRSSERSAKKERFHDDSFPFVRVRRFFINRRLDTSPQSLISY